MVVTVAVMAVAGADLPMAEAAVVVAAVDTVEGKSIHYRNNSLA